MGNTKNMQQIKELKGIGQTNITLDDRNDILRFVSQIHGNIKKEIREDFIFASFGNGANAEKKKRYIIEMTANAYRSKEIMKIMEKRIEEKINMINFKDNLPADIKKLWLEHLKDEKESVSNYSNVIFNTLLTKVNMLTILNRNVDGNYMIDRLSNREEPQIMNNDGDDLELKAKMLTKEG